MGRSLHCRQPLSDQPLRKLLTEIFSRELRENRVRSKGLVSRLDELPHPTTFTASEKQFDPGVRIDKNPHRSSPLSSSVNGLTRPLSAPKTDARIFLRSLLIRAMTVSSMLLP